MFLDDRLMSDDLPQPRLNRWAVGVFVAAIIAAAVFFLVVPALVVCVVALVTQRSMGRQKNIGGHGFVRAAVTISGSALFAGLLAVLLIPLFGRERRIGHPQSCGANLRGIMQSMAVYSADYADSFPIIAFAPYARVPNAPKGTQVSATPEAATNTLYSAGSPQAGSVQACMWLLVLSGQVSPRQFICRSDPFCDPTEASVAADSHGVYYDNFQKPHHLSYSMAYPWNGNGTTGGWWSSANADSGTPLLADMTPKQGTGTPARNLTPLVAPADNRTWNSGNHGGDGQYVAYGDAHAEFQRRPDVGQDHDNIYSMSGSPSKGPAQFGGIAAGAGVPLLGAEKGPWDIIMLPVRDETTGGM